MAAAFQKESLYNCKRGCENLAQVEYVQLLVFQMNSHRIDLQLAGRAITIYIELSPTSSLFLTCFQIVRDFFVNSIEVSNSNHQ